MTALNFVDLPGLQFDTVQKSPPNLSTLADFYYNYASERLSHLQHACLFTETLQTYAQEQVGNRNIY
jgi:hypothetical protein